MVDLNRLENNFCKLSRIGVEEHGGITRLAFSDADWEARLFVIQIMEQAGLKIRIDAFGNIIGRREGLNPQAPVVMLGSHIDSVPNGGNFDGVVGVLAAIEVMHCLEEEGLVTYHPIEIVVFMAEESSRFGAATLGSKAFCGKVTIADLNNFVDNTGISVAEAMRGRDLLPEKISQASYTGAIKSFMEIHIEQGKVLETTGKQIGVITGIAAPTRLKVIVSGQADHSGATPMNMRQDALAAAAEIILALEKVAAAAQHGTVGTTGIIHASPGVMNVIPGKVELGIDIRSISSESKQQVQQQLLAAIEVIKTNRQVDVDIHILTDEQPVQLPTEMVSFLSDICEKGGYSFMKMPSGAGHDAMHLAAVAHTGMVFIPCRAGISHNPAEWADIKDIVAGTELLLTATRKIACREFSWNNDKVE
ncbi:MAG: amidase, hydantoinase/carbamoylase family [Sporomusa sp.]|nr:amidase, hydantoinase/carbamoylase family [Sporomusa sp.]